MALGTLGTAGTTSLVCLNAWSAVLSETDVAALNAVIAPDSAFAAVTDYLPGPVCIFGTGSTHSNTTLDTLVAGTGSAVLTQMKVGDFVIGAGIPPGTFIASVTSGTACVLSAAATATASGVNLAIIHPGLSTGGAINKYGVLTLPGGRGRVRLLPGDVLAVDLVTGWPIVVSAAAISATGSLWSKA